MSLRRILNSYAFCFVLVASCAFAGDLEFAPSYCQSHALREDAALHCVAFAGEVGVACGDRGTILRSEDGGRTWSIQSSHVECPLNEVVWIGPQHALIVGGQYDRITRLSRGVVLSSTDAGRTWSRIGDSELPMLTSIQLRRDRSLVAVGDWSHPMLSRVFESSNRGHHWQSVPAQQQRDIQADRQPSIGELTIWSNTIGSPVAIRSVCRISEHSLCAVGDHGVIYHSDDEGASWNAVRGQGRRTAILIMARSLKSVPWSLLGNESLENDHRSALLIHDFDATILGRQVAAMFGAGSSDQFQFADSSALKTAAEQWIAVHRPAVLLLDESLPSTWRDALSKAAADLQVARVGEYSINGDGPISLHPSALFPNIGTLASDLIHDASHYVSPTGIDDYGVSLRFRHDIAPVARRKDSVVSGLRLSQGQRLSGKKSTASRRSIQVARARINRNEAIATLADASATRFADSVTSILEQTAKEDQFRTLWRIFQKIARNEHEPIKQLILLREISERFADGSSAGKWAQVRLQNCEKSVEWRRLKSILGSEAFESEQQVASSVPVSPFQVDHNPIQQVSATSPVLVAKPDTHYIRQTNPSQQKLNAEVDLVWEFHPFVIISREAARLRGDGETLQPAENPSANLDRLASFGEDRWAGLLQDRSSQVVIAKRADKPPRLDGQLDDDCWSTALHSAGSLPRLRVAHDDQYVYFAIECSGQSLRADASTKERSVSRDHDLFSVDHVELSIDPDKDLTTSLNLRVTDAGRTADSIDQFNHWQPTWYVDTRRDSDKVAIEIAVLRRDLVELPITPGESWFISAKNIVANEGESTLIPDPSVWRRVVFR